MLSFAFKLVPRIPLPTTRFLRSTAIPASIISSVASPALPWPSATSASTTTSLCLWQWNAIEYAPTATMETRPLWRARPVRTARSIWRPTGLVAASLDSECSTRFAPTSQAASHWHTSPMFRFASSAAWPKASRWWIDLVNALLAFRLSTTLARKFAVMDCCFALPVMTATRKVETAVLLLANCSKISPARTCLRQMLLFVSTSNTISP